MRFAGYSEAQLQQMQQQSGSAQPPVGTFIGPPKTFFEMVVFSVTVSIVTQLIIRRIFKD